jgi:hypothetical protein
VGFTFDSVGLDYVKSVNDAPVADMQSFVAAVRAGIVSGEEYVRMEVRTRAEKPTLATSWTVCYLSAEGLPPGDQRSPRHQPRDSCPLPACHLATCPVCTGHLATYPLRFSHLATCPSRACHL